MAAFASFIFSFNYFCWTPITLEYYLSSYHNLFWESLSLVEFLLIAIAAIILNMLVTF